MKSLGAIFLNLLLFAHSNTQPTVPPKLSGSGPTSSESVRDGVFVSTGGGFSISIPQMPSNTIDKASDLSKAKNVDAGKQFVWVFGTILYTATYLIDPEGNPLPQAFVDMEHGTEKAILRDNGKIVSEKQIKYGEYPGIEFRYVSAQGVHFINRSYIVGEMGFQIVGGYAEKKDEKAVLEVLDTFKILKHPKVMQSSSSNEARMEVTLSPIPSLKDVVSKGELEPITKKLQFGLPFAKSKYSPPTRETPNQLQYQWQFTEGLVVMTVITSTPLNFSKMPMTDRKGFLTNFLENSMASIGAQKIFEKDISKGSIAGRELIVKRAQGIVIARAFICADMYVAISAAILSLDKQGEISELFDSITFIN